MPIAFPVPGAVIISDVCNNSSLCYWTISIVARVMPGMRIRVRSYRGTLNWFHGEDRRLSHGPMAKRL